MCGGGEWAADPAEQHTRDDGDDQRAERSVRSRTRHRKTSAKSLRAESHHPHGDPTAARHRRASGTRTGMSRQRAVDGVVGGCDALRCDGRRRIAPRRIELEEVGLDE